MKFRWIEDHRDRFGVRRPCELLSVSRSGFYAWRDRPVSVRDQRNTRLLREIEEEYLRSRGSYGAPRIHRALLERGIDACVQTVAKLMKNAEIRSIRSRRFRPTTTQSSHRHPIARNLLDRQFVARRPNQKWLCDITFIPTGEGMMYLASVLDVCSRRIVGWQIADHLKTELCLDALKMAIDTRRPKQSLIHHSDQGVQYACEEYQRTLEAHGIIASMSRRGNCYDNAMMESFHASFKLELVYQQEGRQFKTKEEAVQRIFEWIEVFYNRQRRHSAIGHVSPDEFEASLN